MAENYNFVSVTHEDAEILVKRFHYSRRMPSNIQAIYGLRLDGGLFGDFGELIAAAIFTIPGTRWSEPVMELARLVRSEFHKPQLSRLLSLACDRLRVRGHDLLVSFADNTHKHHGGIYQASGWNYAGCRERTMDGVIFNGAFISGRAANHKWGTRSPVKLSERGIVVEPHYDEGKFLYWKPLNVRGKTKAKRLGIGLLPYPKPNAARLTDAPLPSGVSHEHTVGAAP